MSAKVRTRRSDPEVVSPSRITPMSAWTPRASRAKRSTAVVAGGIAIVACIAWAYGRSLGFFFDEIDDSTILAAARSGTAASPQFRPVFEAWNRLLFALFSTHALPWRATGLALHAASSILLAWLLVRLGVTRRAAWFAGAAFAVYSAGCETPLWIAADCGLLSVFFALLAAHAFCSHVARPGAMSFAGTLAAAALALGSKQDAVLLAPLLVGIDLRLRPARAPLELRRLVPLASLALVGIAWLWLAYRPAVWARSANVGRYALDAGSPLELVGHVGLLASIGHVEAQARSSVAVLAGSVVLVSVALFAWLSRARRLLVIVGMLVAIFAILPVLPGSRQIVGTRYAYPAAIGVAFCTAAVLDEIRAEIRARARSKLLVAAAFACGAAWIALHGLAVRSISAWKYERRCARFETLLEATRALPARWTASERAFLVAPPVWNVTDFEHGIELFLAPDVRFVATSWLASVDELERERAPGGTFDERRAPLAVVDDAGSIERVTPAERLPIERIERHMLAYVPRKSSERLPVIEVAWAR